MYSWIMRFLNMETGAQHPTSPEEMMPLQTYFAQQCDRYFDLALERSTNPANNIHSRHIPEKIIPSQAPYGLTTYIPPCDMLDAPADTGRVNFRRFTRSYGLHPGYLLQSYIPDYDGPIETYQPPDDWTRRQKKTLEMVDAFRLPSGETCQLDYLGYARHVILLRTGPYKFAHNIALPIRRPTAYLKYHLQRVAPFISAEKQQILQQQGPQAFILHRAGQVLTAAAFMAGTDPLEPARHTLTYAPEI